MYRSAAVLLLLCQSARAILGEESTKAEVPLPEPRQLAATTSVSNAPITGYWLNVASAPDPALSLTRSATTSDGTTVSSSQSSAFTTSIEAGFSFSAYGVGVSASVAIESTQAQSVARDVSRTLERSTTKTFTTNCGSVASSTGQWFMFQWVMSQPGDTAGPGFTATTDFYACTPSLAAEPRCPPGYCANLNCQICLAPYKSLSKKKATTTTA